MRGIALNFFPLATDQFTITLYRLRFVEGARPKTGDEEAVRRYLIADDQPNYYWTLFQQTEGGTEMVCKPFDNSYATLDALRLSLIQSCKNNLKSNEFRLIESFRRRVEIVIATYPEGFKVVSLELVSAALTSPIRFPRQLSLPSR